MTPVALTIAGSDPSGGAGIQADLKTFHQFGVYGEAVITLITVQNTLTVSQVETLSADLVRDQIAVVISDIPPAAAKTGALGSPEIAEAVAAAARSFAFPLVVDPVMISKHGARLIAEPAKEIIRTKLLPSAALVTPNLAEAEWLTGRKVATEDDMIFAGRQIMETGCGAVLIKGGHLGGPPLDLLITQSGIYRFEGVRVETRHTHGTGCTLSAAVTAGLAAGLALTDAIQRAKHFVQAAIETAPNLGSGQGPLNHFAKISN